MSHSLTNNFECVFYSKNSFQIYCQLFVIVSSTYHLWRISKTRIRIILNCAHVDEMMNEREWNGQEKTTQTRMWSGKKMKWNDMNKIEIIKKILLVFLLLLLLLLCVCLSRSLKKYVKLIDVHFWWQIPLTCHPVVYARTRAHTHILTERWYVDDVVI